MRCRQRSRALSAAPRRLRGRVLGRYPELYVRRLGPDGQRLRLRSPQLLGAPGAQLRSSGISNTVVYNYFFRDRYTEEYVPLFERAEFTVLDAEAENSAESR